MKSLKIIKNLILAAGDALILAVSFFTLTVILHNYGNDAYRAIFEGPLSLLVIAIFSWLILAYATELYMPVHVSDDYQFKKNFSLAAATWLIINVVSQPSLFTSSPAKTSLILLGTLLMLLFFRLIWRYLIAPVFIKRRLLFLGNNASLEALIKHIESDSEGAFAVAAHLKDGLNDPDFPRIKFILNKHKIKTIVAASELKNDSKTINELEHLMLCGIRIYWSYEIYETIFEKISISELAPDQIIRYIRPSKKLLEAIANLFSRAVAFLAFIILLPIFILISATIKLTSRGPAIYSQIRAGRFGQTFFLHKFRSMRDDAENSGAQWAAENDSRVTPLGSILRATHLDELPQLWDIARGDLAFIGPRPERPELIGQIKKEVPAFDLRLTVKPGITGWAQINYHYGRSIDDAREKLAYDLYYIKNRSLWLDVKIILRTLKHFIA